MVKRRTMEQWLTSKGFVELPRTSSGHKFFVMNGYKVTLPAHGSPDLRKEIVCQVLRTASALGFDRDRTRQELLGEG